MKPSSIAMFFFLLCLAASFGTMPLQGQTTPVSAVYSLRDDCLLGGFAGGKWLKPNLLKPKLPGKRAYRVVTLAGAAGTVTGMPPKPDLKDEVCPDNFKVVFTPKREPSETAAVAVAAPWNVTPRPVRIAGTTDQTYVKATGEVLAKLGLPKAKVTLAQVVRVDLDGDGTEEVLVAASSYKDRIEGLTDPKAGDHSVVYLRKVVAGKVETVVLVSQVFRQKANLNDDLPLEFEIVAVIDADGDGTMEVVVSDRYYEGAGMKLYRIAGLKALAVLDCGCGL